MSQFPGPRGIQPRGPVQPFVGGSYALYGYVLRKLMLLVPTLFMLTVFVFLMRVLIPGDPVDVMTLGQQVDEETREGLRRALGLDKPVSVQYLNYLKGLSRFDLGTSLRTRQPVAKEMAVRYPNTIRLAAGSLLVAVLLGVSGGVVSAVRKDSAIDLLMAIMTSTGVSMPSFWLGLLLLFQFGVRWQWFPVMGSGSLKHLVLPSLTLGLIFSAIIARLTRSAVLEVLQQDYIRTARAKGLSERVVIYRHALRNALIPVVTIVGLQLGFLLGGAFVVETVFTYPGLGQLAVKSVQYRDFPVIQGITLVVAITTVCVNLAVDVVYGWLNPQIRYR